MRWTAFFRRRHWDRERALELEAYLDQETADNIARGMTPDDARAAAQRRLGNTTLIREEIWLRNSVPVVDVLWRNIRYAVRQLRRAPAFTAAAVVSLALGIGATTAIFTLIDRILLRPLPVRNPGELVLLRYSGHPGGFEQGDGPLSFKLYTSIRDSHTAIIPFGRFPLALSVSDQDWTDRVDGELVTGNYFEVLGVPAELGRTFTSEDDRQFGGHPVAMLSYAYWVERFGADPAVLGRTIRVNDMPLTIVGVSARGFDGVELGFDPRIRIPVAMKREMTGFFGDIFTLENPNALWLQVFGRLRPGVSLERARSMLGAQLPAYLARAGLPPETIHPEGAHSDPVSLDVVRAAQGQSDVREQFGTPLVVLMGLVALVLVMASLNVANLLLARASARRRELAVRLALGAGRRHVVVQSMVESGVLVVLGGSAGLLIAEWANRALVRLIPSGQGALILPTSPDLRIFGFTALVCLGTALLFGMVPAAGFTRLRLLPALRNAAETGRTSSNGRLALVGLQVFLAVLLLMAAGLFVRTLDQLRRLDPGFDTSTLLSFTVDPSVNGYRHQRAVRYFQELLAAVRSVPGVETAALGTIRLLDDDSWGNGIVVEGYTPAPGEGNVQAFNMVSPGYLRTLGIPLLDGRDFDAADARSGVRVAIVNQDMAKRYFGTDSPVGRRFRMGNAEGPVVEIIGLIGPTTYRSLRDTARRQVFLNYDQHTDPTGAIVYVRTRAGESLFPLLRAAVRRIDPHVPTFAERTLAQQINRSLATERLLALLASLFGLMATILAAVGLYGIIAFTVTGRRKEIGLRLALGARAPRLVSLVLRDVMRVVLIGVAAAIPAAWFLSRYVESYLYGVSPGDSHTLAGVAGLLALTAGAACIAPLRRALRVSPMTVLRED
jgi:predicted permease